LKKRKRLREKEEINTGLGNGSKVMGKRGKGNKESEMGRVRGGGCIQEIFPSFRGKDP